MENMGQLGGKNNYDVSNFGGEPFIMHKGQSCHRGAKAFKSSQFHPTETAKRVYYKEDGSGRDGYIKANNGGLTVT